jgi:hypothetical protein
MVMRNRNDGGEASHWWDDLPPKIRSRVTQPAVSSERPERPAGERPLSRRELFRDLSVAAVLFVLLALGVLLYLFVSMTFVTG